MKRAKRHKIKKEKIDASTSHNKEEEHDLAYYIHDRVDLMHQVFSLLKYKEIKAMAPLCVKNLSLGDLQELCTEELLGISSKRLLAILDGAEPPSDTESSSPSPPPEDNLETISLDSISSDEELLSQSNEKKKKHKHRRHSSKSKRKSPPAEESRASRAGLTVLELLELQARARAIRAQLLKEQNNARTSEAQPTTDKSDTDDVEIKEEPPDVVEISSDEEKPNVEQLQREIANKQTETTQTEQTDRQEDNQKVTKRINDLIITVPQKSTRKIKLNRNKIISNISNTSNPSNTANKVNNVATTQKETPTVKDSCKPNAANIEDKTTSKEKPNTTNIQNKTTSKEKPNTTNIQNKTTSKEKPNTTNIENKTTSTEKDRRKKIKKKKRLTEKDSDCDEITLQLSDSEKMDLLEDLNTSRKEYVSFDSDSSSTDDGNENEENIVGITNNVTQTESSKDLEPFKESDKDQISTNENQIEKIKDLQPNVDINKDQITNNTNDALKTKDFESNSDSITVQNTNSVKQTEKSKDLEPNINSDKDQNTNLHTIDDSNDIELKKHTNTVQNDNLNEIEKTDSETKNDGNRVDIPNVSNDLIINTSENEPNNEVDMVDITVETVIVTEQNENTEKDVINEATAEKIEKGNSNDIIMDKTNEFLDTNDLPVNDNDLVITSINDIPINDSDNEKNNDNEVTQQESDKVKSDGELSDHNSSIEAVDLNDVVCISDDENRKTHKKKKKKDKKAKKVKRKKDFRESCDENFYKDTKCSEETKGIEEDTKSIEEETKCIEDDTKCIEEECIELKSSEEDVNEVYELSDDSSCYEVDTILSKEPTAEEIEALSAKIDEIDNEEVNNEINPENISWKDRYLDSKKVKKVLTTANILNALRKKNKQLKKRIEESKIEIETKEPSSIGFEEGVEEKSLEEGSIEHYKTLPSCTKYVDPVKPIEEDNKVTNAMKKDAKQLLKMYKKLLKYNDMNRKSGKDKKKKKKKDGNSNS